MSVDTLNKFLDYHAMYVHLYGKSSVDDQPLQTFMAMITNPDVHNIFVNDINRRGERKLSVINKINSTKARGEKIKARIFSGKIEQEKDPVITAPMIVKNEVETIEDTILSIWDVVDDIFVLDTGSTDGTLEILEKYKPKLRIMRKTIVPWDFSFARNISLAKAQGIYALIIDGDEQLCTDQNDTRKVILDNMAMDHILTTITYQMEFNEHQDFAMSGISQCRMLPLNGKIHYGETVHNKLILDDRDYTFTPSGAGMYHWLFKHKKKKEARIKRTKEFIKEYEAKKEKRYRDLYMLVKLNAMMGNIKEAYSYVEPCWDAYCKLPRDVQAGEHGTLLLMSRACYAVKDYETPAKYLGRHFGLKGKTSDGSFYSHVHFQALGDHETTYNFICDYLERVEEEIFTPLMQQDMLQFYDDMLLKKDLYDLWMAKFSK